MRVTPRILRAGVLGIVLAATASGAEVARTTANDGKLVMEDVPPIPATLVETLNRYQNVRSARLSDWTEDGQGIYISTRFGDLYQVHRVDRPGGARHQLTFFSEPVYGVSRQPGGSQLIFTRDAGGSEFSQVFLFDPDSGDAEMLTDGESRNRGVVWDRQGQRIAYQSTRRNGASNDVWIMDPAEPDKARIALEAPDGTLWGAVEFSERGRQMLAVNYVSTTDARSYAVDLDSGQATLLAGDADDPSYNVPVAYDDDADGYWLLSERHDEFRQLAWQPLDPDAAPTVITTDIPWNVSGAVISNDRRRMAFAVNEGGLSAIYLLDTRTRKYRRVEGLSLIHI